MESIAVAVWAITAVIVLPILAIAGVASLSVWLWHRGRMKKLEIEEKERQAEADRELLGLGDSGISAHLETVLDRLNAIERRLDYLEAVGDIRGKQSTSIPISPGDTATQRRPETEQRQQ
jgi:Tfp pilus assembly protein PilO